MCVTSREDSQDQSWTVTCRGRSDETSRGNGSVSPVRHGRGRVHSRWGAWTDKSRDRYHLWVRPCGSGWTRVRCQGRQTKNWSWITGVRMFRIEWSGDCRSPWEVTTVLGSGVQPCPLQGRCGSVPYPLRSVERRAPALGRVKTVNPGVTVVSVGLNRRGFYTGVVLKIFHFYLLLNPFPCSHVSLSS